MMPIEINGEAYLNTREASSVIGVTRETLNRYVNNGLIRRYKQGVTRTAYYKQSEVQELARKRSEVTPESQQ